MFWIHFVDFVYNDCRSVDISTLFLRFSDDTAMLAVLSDFASYQSYLSSVVRFSSCCRNNFLFPKRNQMCIDFSCSRTIVSHIVISDEPVEQVDSSKYLGVLFCSLQSMSQPSIEVSAATARSSKIAIFQR